MVEICRADKHFDHRYFDNSSCGFGVFDGVHLGHQYILGTAISSAQKSGGKSIALTFDIDPDEMFHPDRLRKLMTNEDRIATLATTGVDAVVVLPFTREFSSQSPFDFLSHTFNGYPPKHLHIGSDFKFGARAAGSVAELEQWGDKLGVAIHAVDLKSFNGEPISSTRIRKLLAETKISKANELLGRPYFIHASVEPGRGEGVDLGFRTANIRLSEQMQVLGEGVYAAYGVVDKTPYKAAVSVGVTPTFANESTATCEVHLIDFSGDLYGKSIKVEFIEFLRPMLKFNSKIELMETVQSNIEWARKNL